LKKKWGGKQVAKWQSGTTSKRTHIPQLKKTLKVLASYYQTQKYFSNGNPNETTVSKESTGGRICEVH
jgi:hypothetical protein